MSTKTCDKPQQSTEVGSGDHTPLPPEPNGNHLGEGSGMTPARNGFLRPAALFAVAAVAFCTLAYLSSQSYWYALALVAGLGAYGCFTAWVARADKAGRPLLRLLDTIRAHLAYEELPGEGRNGLR